MKNIEIISLDIFQTLVDVNARMQHIWAGILESDYTAETAMRGFNSMNKCLGAAMQTANSSETFIPMREVFVLCAQNAMKLTGMDIDPEKIAYHVMRQHAYAPFYDEVAACLKQLGKEYRIILCSDSNHLMVDELVTHINHERLFISEDLRCYKGDFKNRFFRAVLSELKIPAEKILHIGDSPSDVFGAHNVGIMNCWINRRQGKWNHDTPPDYSISRMDELPREVMGILKGLVP